MQCSNGRYLRGVVSPNLHTLRHLLRGGSGLVSLPNSPNYAVFQRPLPQVHQLIDLTGAKHNHAVFQRPLPQGCRLSYLAAVAPRGVSPSLLAQLP